MTEEEIRAMIKETVGPIVAEAISIAVPEMVSSIRSTLAEDAKPKIMVAGDEYLDLLSRGGAISPDAKLKVADMVGEGKNRTEIVNALLDMATPKTDATDTGGGADLDITRTTTTAPVTSFRHIEDDDFFTGLSNPSAVALH